MEEWKNVVGYEGYYEVSSLGNVRSVTRKRLVKEKKRERHFEASIKGQNIKPNTSGKYLRVLLSKDDTKKAFSVHRLVAEAFIPNPNNLPEVNHIDEDKKNNKVENLEWVTHKQNMNHGTLPERRKHFRVATTPIIQYDLNGNKISEYNSIVEASKATGINKNSIETGLSRKGYCKGYIWKYKKQ